MALRYGLPATYSQKSDSAGRMPAAPWLVPRKLLVKFRVVISAAKQFVVRAAFNDFSALQHQDLVGVSNRGKPVGNYKTGAALEQLLQRVLNQGFGVRIDRARCFVQNEDARPGDHRAHEADELSFASAEIRAAFGDCHFIALLEAGDDVVRAQRLRR